MSKLVLLVDDSATIQQLVRLAFAGEGLDLFAAQNVSEARQWLSTHSPDLILSDVSLPDGSGLSFLKELRESTRTSNIPVLLLAPAGMATDVALTAGADGVLVKPFESMALLVSTVREYAARPSQLSLPHLETVVAKRVEYDSILELDDLDLAPPARERSTVVEGSLEAILPLLVERVAARVVERVRDAIRDEIVQSAVPEIVRQSLNLLSDHRSPTSNGPSDIDEAAANQDH